MTTTKQPCIINSTYNYKKMHNGFHVVFSDSLSLIDNICKDTEKFMKIHAIAKTRILDIELGVREALSNAIRHGAAKTNNTMIQYRLRYDQKQFIIVTVTDPGPGFDWNTAMKRVLPCLTESGRGIFIMQNCFDTIKFNERGNEITLLKMVHKEKRANE